MNNRMKGRWGKGGEKRGWRGAGGEGEGGSQEPKLKQMCGKEGGYTEANL